MIERPLLQRFRARHPLEEGETLKDLVLSTQPANLLGYYPCDDPGTQLADYSGNGNHLPELGTGHSYGVPGHMGDAVNGNQTGGWGATTAQFTGYKPGDNGFTHMAMVHYNGYPLLSSARLFGLLR